VLCPGEIALFNFGWGRRWTAPPANPGLLQDWPGLTVGCAEILLDRGVVAVGSDTISPDIYGAPGDPVHHILLRRGVLIYEGLAKLDELPPRFFFMGLPLPIRNGSGSPVRAIAFVSTSAREEGIA
jgi:kynurenine formamidase